ncbi:MAG: serine hydrolase domain-containing protein [Bacteroidota bacterium]
MRALTCTVLLTLLTAVQAPYCFGQEDDVAVLIASLEEYMQTQRIPGAMVSIVRADTVLFMGGIGYASIERNEPVSAEHLFRQGSVSKSFTAFALLSVLRDTEYSLDTPIRDINPSLPFANRWASEHPVRVVHLLEHTSGFDDFHLHAIYNTTDSTLPPIANMVHDHRPSLTSRWQPGTRKSYSNPNYVVAGHLIEVLAGSPYDAYISERILRPMGMASSGFYFKQPDALPFATGYQRRGATLTPLPFATINGGPAGDLAANATDMAAFLQVMLTGGDRFSLAELERIETPQTTLAAKAGLTYGYGLGNFAVWRNGHLFHGHDGGIDGFSARYAYSRAADLGVAVAINRNGNATAMVRLILDHVLGEDAAPSGERIAHPIPDSIRAAYAGFYEFRSPRNELLGFSDRMLAGLTLDFDTDTLITRTLLGKAKDTLYYAGQHRFYRTGEGSPTAALLTSDSGNPVFWINDSYTERGSRLVRVTLFFAVLCSFLLVAVFCLYAVPWLLLNLFKAERRSPANHLAVLGFGVCLALFFTGLGLSFSQIPAVKSMPFSTLLVYGSSYLLAATCAYALYRGTKLPPGIGFRIFFMLTSVGSLIITIYLWDAGFIGLKLWSY